MNAFRSKFRDLPPISAAAEPPAEEALEACAEAIRLLARERRRAFGAAGALGVLAMVAFGAGFAALGHSLAAPRVVERVVPRTAPGNEETALREAVRSLEAEREGLASELRAMGQRLAAAEARAEAAEADLTATRAGLAAAQTATEAATARARAAEEAIAPATSAPGAPPSVAEELATTDHAAPPEEQEEAAPPRATADRGEPPDPALEAVVRSLAPGGPFHFLVGQEGTPWDYAAALDAQRDSGVSYRVKVPVGDELHDVPFFSYEVWCAAIERLATDGVIDLEAHPDLLSFPLYERFAHFLPYFQTLGVFVGPEVSFHPAGDGESS